MIQLQTTKKPREKNIKNTNKFRTLDTAVLLSCV
jgi:hypothetical protein